jgi:predicted SAM-dependent methyltransferase
MTHLAERRALNLGCGNKSFPDSLGVDIRETPVTDMVLDLETFPWPFEDERFETVYAYDIIEHLTDVIGTMGETWRILKPGGRLLIHTNHYKHENAFNDPTHKHFFALHSFDYWDERTYYGKNYGYYTGNAKFRIEVKREDGQELYFELTKVEKKV